MSDSGACNSPSWVTSLVPGKGWDPCLPLTAQALFEEQRQGLQALRREGVLALLGEVHDKSILILRWAIQERDLIDSWVKQLPWEVHGLTVSRTVQDHHS